MNCEAISAEYLSVLDDVFFTEIRFREWYNTLINFSCETISLLRDKTGNIEGIAYEINTVMLQEVVYDAMVGLKTIVGSVNNKVEAPNPFKIAAHLGYWFVRHKPIIFRAEKNLDINKLHFAPTPDEKSKVKILTEIKHINELAASHFLLRYIFKVECAKPVCTKSNCNKVKKKSYFCFDDFKQMLVKIQEKLIYHLTYRDISPKIIEHFLEAYTLHPYIPYTCDLWNTEEEVQ